MSPSKLAGTATKQNVSVICVTCSVLSLDQRKKMAMEGLGRRDMNMCYGSMHTRDVTHTNYLLHKAHIFFADNTTHVSNTHQLKFKHTFELHNSRELGQ